MKRVLDDIMARLQEEATSKRHLLELGKLLVNSPTGNDVEQQAKLEAVAAATRNDT